MNKFKAKLGLKFNTKSGIVFEITRLGMDITDQFLAIVIVNNNLRDHLTDDYFRKEFYLGSRWSFDMDGGTFERGDYRKPYPVDFLEEYKPIKTVLPLP